MESIKLFFLGLMHCLNQLSLYFVILNFYFHGLIIGFA